MTHSDDTLDTATAADDDTAHADGAASHEHECEFCSPEPEIMPPPRSGAVRAASQPPPHVGGQAIGELLT